MRTINRSEVAALRDALRILQLVVAEVDAELRYRWIDSPHPDFAADAVVGKRDDELVPPAEAAEIMDFKRSVIAEGRPRNRILGFHRTDGWRYYSVSAFPLREQDGPIDGMLTVGFEAVAAVASLIPLCANCHSIRDEHGQWHGLEQFVENRTRSHFTHGLCPSCVREFEEGRPPRPSRTPR